MENKDGYSETDAQHVELYGDPGIASRDTYVPRWLVINNWFWVVFGLFWMFYYWNGSHGWLDRGYWSQLQRAANTAYPYTTHEIVEKETLEKRAEKKPNLISK
jgi:hypothetical protein